MHSRFAEIRNRSMNLYAMFAMFAVLCCFEAVGTTWSSEIALAVAETVQQEL